MGEVPFVITVDPALGYDEEAAIQAAIRHLGPDEWQRMEALRQKQAQQKLESDMEEKRREARHRSAISRIRQALRRSR